MHRLADRSTLAVSRLWGGAPAASQPRRA